MNPNKVNIRTLAKVSLHDHLDGGLRPETIIEFAKARGIKVPSDNPQELAAWFVTKCSGGELVDYLKTFELTVSIMQTTAELERVAYEFAIDLAADGVIYGEVRWAPEQHTREGLTMKAAVAAVQRGFQAATGELVGQGKTFRVTQILCAMRHQDNSLDVAKLAVTNRDSEDNPSGVVGFDLAGPETGFLPDRHVHALNFLAKNYFPVTIHAGEEGDLNSIKSAIFQRALRLGHGTRLAKDITLTTNTDGQINAVLGQVAQWVKDRQLTIESCPTSNLQTNSAVWGTKLTDHPFNVFYQLGMNITVNTDNRLMSGVTLTSELELLAQTFGYDQKDITQFQVNAAMSAFLPLEDRFELASLIKDNHRQFLKI